MLRVCVNAQQSEPQSVDCSVPQGSVLGPMKFTAYTEDLADLINNHQLGYHLYADDTSPLDVLPVSLLKDCTEVFAPAITTLANLSLQTGKFPLRFKSAQMLRLLTKAGLDRSLPVNYRPISN